MLPGLTRRLPLVEPMTPEEIRRIDEASLSILEEVVLAPRTAHRGLVRLRLVESAQRPQVPRRQFDAHAHEPQPDEPSVGGPGSGDDLGDLVGALASTGGI